jgi:hypothetical protein
MANLPNKSCIIGLLPQTWSKQLTQGWVELNNSNNDICQFEVSFMILNLKTIQTGKTQRKRKKNQFPVVFPSFIEGSDTLFVCGARDH